MARKKVQDTEKRGERVKDTKVLSTLELFLSLRKGKYEFE
jgi:hypothetical protein